MCQTGFRFLLGFLLFVFAGHRLLVRAQMPRAGSLIWNEEFDGSTPHNWINDIGGNGWGNQELEYYTSGRDNIGLDGRGNLYITARSDNAGRFQCWYGRCSYTSAKIKSPLAFKYGRIEARVQVPPGAGMWPAVWMLGNKFLSGTPWPYCGEIDIMEWLGGDPNVVHGSLHGGNNKGDYDPSVAFNTGVNMSAGFHTYTIDWVPGSITFYVDGRQYAHFTSAGVPEYKWRFDSDFFYVILNLAVGSKDSWGGAPNGSTRFPGTMLVDYVRVWNPPGSQKAADLNSVDGGGGTPMTQTVAAPSNGQTFSTEHHQQQSVRGKMLMEHEPLLTRSEWEHQQKQGGGTSAGTVLKNVATTAALGGLVAAAAGNPYVQSAVKQGWSAVQSGEALAKGKEFWRRLTSGGTAPGARIEDYRTLHSSQ